MTKKKRNSENLSAVSVSGWIVQQYIFNMCNTIGLTLSIMPGQAHWFVITSFNLYLQHLLICVSLNINRFVLVLVTVQVKS